MRTLFHFLGSLYFALILIFLSACFAIAGTFLESATDSHHYAAIFTYDSPLFSLLLWGYFFNILISALRRFPFKLRHIPFLITHFGMLMILAGSLIKSYFGTQGNMVITEGSSSNEIFLPKTFALYLEAKNADKPQFYLINKNYIRYSALEPLGIPETPYTSLAITLIDYSPNSLEKIESWVKNGHLHIFGLRPLPLQTYHLQDELPHAIQVQLPSNDMLWHLYALKSNDDPVAIAEKAYKKAKPAVVIIQNKEDEIFITLINQSGEVGFYKSSPGNLKGLLAYDDGFLGYTMEAHFPELKDYPLLESPLSARHQAIPPSKKLESNAPGIAIRMKHALQEEILTLTYCPYGNGFKWPILNGQYIARFQPLLQKIPYSLRLRQARQINYPGSQQPYSYECDLLITHSDSGQVLEKSISMNNVHETWDGYRFYLSSISPQDKGAVKHVQIVVNRDPAKYWLTYPGAFLMTLGIIFLFFLPKRKI